MKIAISNIAWKSEEEQGVVSLLRDMGIKGIEIAPGKIASDPLSLTENEIFKYREFWRRNGIEIIAMQALLFGKPELTIFDSEKIRAETLKYLKAIISIAGLIRAKILVFGAPKNRNRGKLSTEEADKIAIPFFRELGRFSTEKKVKLCLEPNPKEYGTDYIQTASEAIDMVKKVNNPGFGLHLDAGGLIMSGDSAKTIIGCKDYIAHFHISEPLLSPNYAEHKEIHGSFADALRLIKYQNWVSIEMRQTNSEAASIAAVKEALRFALEIYY